jgi:hypothetical protein
MDGAQSARMDGSLGGNRYAATTSAMMRWIPRRKHLLYGDECNVALDPWYVMSVHLVDDALLRLDLLVKTKIDPAFAFEICIASYSRSTLPLHSE